LGGKDKKEKKKGLVVKSKLKGEAFEHDALVGIWRGVLWALKPEVGR